MFTEHGLCVASLSPKQRSMEIAFMDSAKGWSRFVLREKKNEVEGVKSFYFEPRQNSLDFVPGQHVILRFSDLESDPRGKMRHFSISTSPLERNYIGITTTIKPDGSPFKRRLDNVKVGESVDILGPIGKFTFESKFWKDRIIVLIAGGIGITPFRSMIKYALSNDGNFRIRLLYSSKQESGFVFRDELDRLASDDKRLRIFYTVTGETGNGMSGIHIGRIDSDFVTASVEDLDDSIFYVCGPPRMVDEIAGSIGSKLRIDKDSIRVEHFLGY